MICPHCEKFVEDDQIYCPYCGNSVKANNSNSTNVNNKAQTNKRFLLQRKTTIILSICLCLCLLTIAIIPSSKNEISKNNKTSNTIIEASEQIESENTEQELESESTIEEIDTEETEISGDNGTIEEEINTESN